MRASVFAYNTSPHASTRETPFFVLHGFDARTPLDGITLGFTPDGYTLKDLRDMLRAQCAAIKSVVMENTREAQERSAARHTKNVKPHTFERDDLVLSVSTYTHAHV